MCGCGLDYEQRFAGVATAQQAATDEITDAFRWDWHQLLVIGNGFDLEAGLPSKFSDFFEARKPLWGDGRLGPSTLAAKLGFKKNVWDLILSQGDRSNWCDIEGAVADWVVPKGRPTLSPQCPAEKVLEYATDDSHFIDGGGAIATVAEYINWGSGQNLKHWDIGRLYRYLLSELHNLEIDFDSYLNDAVSGSETYLNNARALLSTLIKDESRTEGNYNRSTSVLSFNYTSPVDKGTLRYKDGRPISYVNIHGELKQGIIFGIDGAGLLGDPLVLPFTKTYRIMERGGTKPSEIVHKEDASERNCGTQLIKFYGHSLGSADYSYFQSIFDTVGLYGGSTRLIFYFKPYGSLSVEDARSDMMGRAIHLLDAYGKTLDNADHGKNLIHKLILEGRLLVKQIPDYQRAS